MFTTINSGISTSAQALSVTANNLANTNTVGFKKSTINFADVFANDPAANPKTAVGLGAQTTDVERIMSQGSITSTGRVTDLAITGQGFFVLKSPPSTRIPPANIPIFNGANLQAGNWTPPVLPTPSPIPDFNGEMLPVGSFTQPTLPQLDVRVRYNLDFENGDFSDVSAIDNGTRTSIPGWEIVREQVKLGQGTTAGSSTIAGSATPIDNTNPPNSLGDDTTQSGIKFYSDLTSGAVRLYSEGSSVNGYDVIHGPYLASKDPIYIAEGAKLSFDWKAQNGDDNYDVFGYLLNSNGDKIELLDATGETQNWTTREFTMPQGKSGDYRFVFVSGTYDATGGKLTGASLYIDNITITNNSLPTNTGDTYSVSIDGSTIDFGGPVVDKTTDLSSYIDENGNSVSVQFNNPDGSWAWSYEILKDGLIVQSGSWPKSDTGIKIAQYNLASIEPASTTTVAAPTPWTLNNISGTCSNVFFCDAGQGTAAHDGFSGRDHFISFGNGGVAGERILSFDQLDLTLRESISFDVIRGNNDNGGQSPDQGEDLVLEYSTDGIQFQSLETFANNDLSLNGWTRRTVTLPPEAQTATTTIRFKQPASSGPEFDHWGLANIVFDPVPPPPEPASSAATNGEEYAWTAPSMSGTAKGVFINSAGAGSTDVDGFTGRASYIGFGFGGDEGERYLTLDQLDTRQKEFIKFDIIRGNNTNGGQSPDVNEGVKLLYSTDGTNFHELSTFDPSSIVYEQWTSIKINLPPEARDLTTTFKFIQPETSGPGYDHWGLSNIELTDEPIKEEVIPVAYTRAGNFQIDKDGFVVNTQGMRLLGYDLKNSKELEPIRIQPAEDRFVEGISIDPKGLLSVTYSNGTIETPFQVSLASFASDSGLKPIGNTLFTESSYSGKARYGFPGTNGIGNLMSGSLEQSNTDITAELMLMMKYQQAFSGNSRMLQTYVEMSSRLTDKI